MSVLEQERIDAGLTSTATTPAEGEARENGTLTVKLVDHQGRSRRARLPAGVALGRVKEQILERLDASPFDSNGVPVAYDLVHNGVVLGEDDTLDAARAVEGDQLELSPSIQSATAGW